MADDALAGLQNGFFLESLSPEEKGELRLRRYLRTGNHVIWIEPERIVRKEKLADLYYIRTDRGVFRVSRLTNEIIEV